MKRKKIKDLKFIRKIMIGIISLLIVAFIINIAPGYKRDKNKNIINLILNEENITNNLVNQLYINENGTVYISEEDVKNIFDPTIYYDEKYNQIITTSDTKVANIVINKREMSINSSNVNMLDPIIKINNNLYLPISDMAIVYNIKINYIRETNKVIIDKLDTGMIKATVVKNSKIKYKPRGLSKNIGEIKQGEIVTCYYTTSKGWRQIRKDDGTIGYVKANKLGDEYIVRQDMKERGNAAIIQKSEYDNNVFEISTSTGVSEVVLKSIYNIKNEDLMLLKDTKDEEENSKLWVAVTNNSIRNQTNELLNDYYIRTSLIELIVKKSIENNINGVSIDFTGIQDGESMKRFVIECAPKLRESGISTCIVLHENIEKQDYLNIVDYIVE